MTNAYDPVAWREVYLMLGGALAALAGLLFVAISVRIAVIGKSPYWRVRAFGITSALVGLLIVAALVMLPQETEWLGAELIVMHLVLLAFVPVRSWIILHRLGATEAPPRLRLIAGIALWSIGALGGLSLLAGFGGGMYLVMLCCLGQIWLCVLNAWSFIMVGEPTAR